MQQNKSLLNLATTSPMSRVLADGKNPCESSSSKANNNTKAHPKGKPKYFFFWCVNEKLTKAANTPNKIKCPNLSPYGIARTVSINTFERPLSDTTIVHKINKKNTNANIGINLAAENMTIYLDWFIGSQITNHLKL